MGGATSVQDPGGTGALRVVGDYLKSMHSGATIWMSDPTWANHNTIFQAAGLQCEAYDYRDPATNGLDFDAMLASIKIIPSGDVILLHGCCHNPCGADLSETQWNVVAELCGRLGVIPFIDFAYQGLAKGLYEDAYGVRAMAKAVPEFIVVTSCSKLWVFPLPLLSPFRITRVKLTTFYKYPFLVVAKAKHAR